LETFDKTDCISSKMVMLKPRWIIFIGFLLVLLSAPGLALADSDHHKNHGSMLASPFEIKSEKIHHCKLNHRHLNQPCPHTVKSPKDIGLRISTECGGKQTASTTGNHSFSKPVPAVVLAFADYHPFNVGKAVSRNDAYASILLDRPNPPPKLL
jgi:hypothetical protein